MKFETASEAKLDDTLLQALITGWAKSRGGRDVTLVHESGHTHCVFRTPIGSQPRDRESFYWNSTSIIESVSNFQQGRHHYLSVFANDELPDSILTAAGYKLLVREMLMSRPVGAGVSSTNIPVKRIQSEAEVDWFNRQKGHTFIQPEHFNDNDVFDFYTREGEMMTSCARAIRHDHFFIVDDVQTHPDYRRKGLASGMLAKIAATASQAGAHTEILIASEGGIPLYLKEHFQPLAPLRVFVPQN